MLVDPEACLMIVSSSEGTRATVGAPAAAGGPVVSLSSSDSLAPARFGGRRRVARPQLPGRDPSGFGPGRSRSRGGRPGGSPAALEPGGVVADAAFVDVNLATSGGPDAGMELVRSLAGRPWRAPVRFGHGPFAPRLGGLRSGRRGLPPQALQRGPGPAVSGAAGSASAPARAPARARAHRGAGQKSSGVPAPGRGLGVRGRRASHLCPHFPRPVPTWTCLWPQSRLPMAGDFCASIAAGWSASTGSRPSSGRTATLRSWWATPAVRARVCACPWPGSAGRPSRTFYWPAPPALAARNLFPSAWFSVRAPQHTVRRPKSPARREPLAGAAERPYHGRMKRSGQKVIVSWLMLGSSVLTFGTGLVLTFGLHAGPGSFRASVLGLGRLTWLNLHRLPAILLLTFLVLHLALNWKPFTAPSGPRSSRSAKGPLTRNCGCTRSFSPWS